MNQNKRLPEVWRQYELGKEYKERIGLFDRVRENERFYRGDQWSQNRGAELPRPVFNIIRRVCDYLIGSVARASFRIDYTDERVRAERDKEGALLRSALSLLTDSAAARWENDRMDRTVYRLLLDAAISGDGILYCCWDPEKRTGQPFTGDIVTETVDSTNLYVADVNRPDIQSQEYVILSGRASVKSLREEARRNGASDETVNRIRPDEENLSCAGDLSSIELSGEENAKATYLVYFYKENGTVHFEKSTRDAVIARADTGQRLYPIAYFSWMPAKNSFHGTSPITGMIPNQRFINRAYAMAMKHMQDTAFSKVIYDKSRIPEWSNEIGEAIGANGGGNISDAVQVVGVGEMQDGFTELIRRAIEDTKEMAGATEAALGDAEARNTSAILALQESAQIPLRQVRTAFLQCLEDLGDIWADMTLAYYPAERLLASKGTDEPRTAGELFILRDAILSARVSAEETGRYTAAASQNLLDKLLDGGYITPEEYLSRIPDGAIAGKLELITRMRERGNGGDGNG